MDSIIQWFAQEWASALSDVILSMTGEKAEACAGQFVSSPPDGVGWLETLTITEGTRLCVRLPEVVYRAIGGRVMQAAGLPEDDQSSLRDAAIEVVRQSLSQLASKVEQRIRANVGLQNGHSSGDALPGFLWQEVILTLGGDLPPCAIGISPELSVALERSHQATAVTAAGGACQTPASHSTSSQVVTTGPVPQNSKTLDLLLEVELPIGVSFGRTQMRLKEAMRLTTGSIVELNRSVTEPVELIANNCVIARGEVVVVDGNYGVRILEIISREERLRTLF